MNNAKKDHLIEILDSKIKFIKKAKKLCNESQSFSSNKMRKKYYFEVAYFIHSIKENYELNQLFNELLQYKENLLFVGEYRKTKILIEDSIKTISKELLNRNDFEKYKDKLGNTWKNPFDNWGTLGVQEILERLGNLNDNKLILDFSDLRNLLYNDDGLNGIINRWYSENNENFEVVFRELDLITEKIQVLEYFEEFKYEFIGAKAAKILNQFYLLVHPIYEEGIFSNLKRSAIIKGEDLEEFPQLLNYCEVLRDYLKNSISNKFSIETSIFRFKHYMEVFFDKDLIKNPEKDLQKDFELFLFNNGYFALSEGQVGDGRFDDIVISQNNAFLCELKQDGFGKNRSGTTNKKMSEKVESAKIQTKIYHERLREFPNLSNEVFIIIFCQNYSRFKNDKNQIEVDNLIFNFYLINLNKDSPSKQKSVNYINIESHFDKL